MKRRTITQKELAEILGVQRSNLSEFFRGKRRFGAKRSARSEQTTDIGLRLWLFGTPNEIKAQLEKVYGKINFRRGRVPLKKEGRK